MTIEKARRDKVEIAYETFGGPPGEPLLLVMGSGAQMIYWHDEFCAALVERRFWVARFDNRDAGLSTHLSSAGVPNQLRMLRRPGGMIAQTMVVRHPSRVLSLTSISSTPSARIGRASLGMALRLLLANPADRRPALAAVRVPTLVVHGEADPLVRVVGGRETAAVIPGARLVTFVGMGHDLPRELWPAIIDKIRAVADRAADPDGLGC